MSVEKTKFETTCSHSDIAAYLDGELGSDAELRLEMHIASCGDCFNALSEQKMVLCALNAALDRFDQHDQIELPVNFARKVTVHAESAVNGLRKREERFTAVVLCTILLVLTTTIILAGNYALKDTFEQTYIIASSIGSVIGAAIYDVGLGTVVIVRTLTRYFLSESNLYSFGGFCVLIISLILCTRFYPLLRRLKF